MSGAGIDVGTGAVGSGRAESPLERLKREPVVGAARTLSETAPAAQIPKVTMRHAAWITLGASVGLAGLGILSINLTSGVGAEGMSYHGLRQTVFLLIGLMAAALVAAPHYRHIRALTPALAVGAIGLLVFVLVPWVPESIVTPRNGARRWISLGFTDFQPSELAKIAYVLAMASYFRFRKNYRTVRGLVPPALITLVPMGLVLVEPDLGTASLFVPTLFAMLIAAGARLKHLAVIVVVMGVSAPAMYPALRPHQKARVQAMINQIKGDDRYNDTINYQGDRARTLVGAGGLDGLGAEKSRAVVDFNELPEDHNDMIFAVISNRFGFVGGLATMGLYLAWAGGALLTAAGSKDPYGRLVCVGLAGLVTAQAGVNIGMTVGLLPITGMTLPFVSYGGSSLVASFLMVGLIFNVAMRRPAYLQRKSFEFGDE